MRIVHLTKYGIHFEVKGRMINAHWTDLFGCGINKKVKNSYLLSMKRFWEHVISGVKLLIKGDCYL